MVIKQKGQSLIEVIFSVGVLVMVIAAVISLVVKTTGIKTMELQRKKASEMSEVIIENLLENKKNSPDTFWQLNDITNPQTLEGYGGYTYVVDFSLNTDGNCSDIENECADVTITVSWADGQTFVVKRFFSKIF